ncbi:ParB/RepB/Spo0J family partition protein [Roseobacter sp. OBYS 0001]|uniref:ParB/RepB/Spo0J family partition protein n=1 Tax=Roseobacter sp. OBYS 0001 TaxID=882651 RepID=UPI001BC66D02|nr:ParB/RepB/Spo0J family partition protein [Roseobacter sp. OBYS 0001]GIT85439.1 hypothetical protein ROBYS_04550 [Roseobacter sp. OBYS 0001]
MTRSNTPQITFLPVSDIQVRDRLRDTSEAAVAALEASIPERGILSPLQVQLVKGTYCLMDGLHRLEGARRCGLDEVPVIIRNCSMREARNIEVDTALAAAPLDSLSMAVFLAAQKDLYEEEFPEAKRLHAANATLQGDRTVKNTVRSFADNAADIFNVSTSKIFKLVSVGKSLTGEDVKMLRKAPKKVKFGDLQAMAKLDASLRSLVCRELSLGKIKSVKEALERSKKPGSVVTTSPAEAEFKKLNDAFARASKAARMQFVRAHSDALEELMARDVMKGGDGEVVEFKARERG